MKNNLWLCLSWTIISVGFIIAMALYPIYRLGVIVIVSLIILTNITIWFSSRFNVLVEHWEYRNNLKLNIVERTLGIEGITSVIEMNPMAIKSIGSGKISTHSPKSGRSLALDSGPIKDEYFPPVIYIKDFRLSGTLEKLFLGLLGDGQQFYLDFTKWIHTVVVGTTGSGKSEFAHVILTQILLAREHVMVDLIDFASGTFVDYNIPFASNIEEAERVFQKWALEFERRRSLFRNTRNDKGLAVKDLEEYNRFSDSPLPYAVMMMEEAGTLYRDSDIIKGIMKDLLSQARKQGLHIFFMAQSAKAEHLPTDLRDLFQTKVQFQVNEKSLAGMLISGVTPEDYTQSGMAFIDQGREGKKKFQAPLVEEYRLKARVEEPRDIQIDPVIIDLASDESVNEEEGSWPIVEDGTSKERMTSFAEQMIDLGIDLEEVPPVEVVKHLDLSGNGRDYREWQKTISSVNGNLQ